MSNKKSGKRRAAAANDDTALDIAAETDAAIAAQQDSMRAGDGAGYVGTMSAEAMEREEERQHEINNHAEDSAPSRNVAPAVLGRHPDAVATDEDEDVPEEGAALGQPGSRVGFLSVEHPRARMALALHDRLDGRKPSAFTADELSDHAEKVGMNVEGADGGDPLKSDFVREMDSLLDQHPHAPVGG